MAAEVGAQEPTTTKVLAVVVAEVRMRGLVLVLMPYRLRWTL